MNAVLGAKVSIVSPKPQTTRNRILGVLTQPGKAQLVFIDTPGIHTSPRRLNRLMNDAALSTLGQTDVVVFVTEAPSLQSRPGEPFWGGDAAILAQLATHGVPVVLVVNKIDLLKRRHDLLPLLESVADAYAFAEILPTSATRDLNIARFVDTLVSALPIGEPMYPEDMLTDRAERFIASELIREQVLVQTHNEVPYGIAIEIEEFSDSVHEGKLYISAVIHVERDSQKGILIGKGAQRLKKIGTEARVELEKFFGRPIHLQTFVRVEQGWTEDVRRLARFGYNPEEI